MGPEPMSEYPAPTPTYGRRQRIGLPLGPVLALLVLAAPLPDALGPDGQRALAVGLLMAVWWVSEALPVAATALVPVAAFPLLGVLDARTVAASYADPVVFLFLGGFLIAMAAERHGLHRRVGVGVVRALGTSPARLLAGFMAAAALLSMAVSNTATAVMLLPIAAAVTGMGSSTTRLSWGGVLLLGVAYAASIGGMATLIGSPPNAIMAGQARALFPAAPEITFARWLGFALPIAAGFLVITWAYLALVVGRRASGTLHAAALAEERPGPWARGEAAVAVVFILTALAWVFRANIDLGVLTVPGWADALGLEELHDGVVAIAASVVLFALPIGRSPARFILTWEAAVRLPWHVLILFGGGFALAEAFASSGLTAWMGSGLGALGHVPVPVLVLAVCLGVTFLTEVTSNTATASVIVPIAGAAAAALGIHPYLLMVPAALSASCAFMLPVATPPNAVAFGTGLVSIPQMARAGLALNLAGAVWISLMSLLLVPAAFGV
jgi:sodium-dependent dicarboxylate transporter 2/3/5